MIEKSRPSKDATFTKNIFFGDSTKHHDISAGEHNAHHLLPSAPRQDKSYLEEYYAQRGLAMGVPGNGFTRMGLLVAATDEKIQSDVKGQISYVNEIRGKGVPKLEIFSPRDIRDAENSLVVPYLNPTDEEKYLQSLNAEIYGPPGVMVDGLNNKATAHDLVARYSEEVDPEFRVVEHKVIATEDVTIAGAAFMKGVIDRYDEVGLLDAYRSKNAVGVVLRGADSDGGFGISKVKQVGDTWTVDTSPGVEFSNYNDAFAASQGFFETMNTDVEDRIVMTRFMDVEDSPGMSVVVADGHVYSLGWNGQTQVGEDTACVGTTNYNPEVNSQSDNMYQQFKDTMAEKYEGFMRWYAPQVGVNFDELKMIVNQDMMTPTSLEEQYQELSGQPKHMAIAEFNFRLSERTDTVVGAAIFGGTDQSPKGFTEVIDRGLTTYLKYPLPVGTDPREVRDVLGEKYKESSTESGLVVVRVAPTPKPEKHYEVPTMGVVIYGDNKNGESSIKEAISEVKSR